MSSTVDHPAERLEALVALFNEHNTDARWQEECREKSSSAIIAANSVIVGIIAAFQLQFPFIIFCVVQFVLAQTGQKFILKYHALSERRHAYSKELEKIISETSGLTELGVEKVINAARTNQLARLQKSSRLAKKLVNLDDKTSIHELWYDLHTGFKIMSVLLAGIICFLDLQSAHSVLREGWSMVASAVPQLR